MRKYSSTKLKQYGRLFLFICAIILIINVAIIFIKKAFTTKTDVTTISEEAIVVEPSQIIPFSEIGVEDFTCTGLTFDQSSQTFWIADYGAMEPEDNVQPRLIQVSKDFKHVENILLMDQKLEGQLNLQGIAYDKQDDALWIAGGTSVYQISKDGNVLKVIDLHKYQDYQANGISYDIDTDTIWILFFSKWLLNINKDGRILHRAYINYYDQDMIYQLSTNQMLISVGADYQGENNFLLNYNPKEKTVNQIYRLKKSYAIEGICVLENKLFVLNDGYFHKSKIKNSYVAIYDFN